MLKKDILKQLTIDEKIKWTSGNNMWQMLGLERLGIEQIMLADGPHGVRVYKELTSEADALNQDALRESTMFPSAAAMASTFNPKLIKEVGRVIGDECNMFGVEVLLAPGVNQKRSPLGGRNFEYYSEDPYLTGQIGAAFIEGVQSKGVGTCVKHFATNEQETLRRYINTVVDKRTLHEFYLAPFKHIITQAKPYTIMSAYNRIGGDYASESSYLLQDVLRGKWGFDGVVISDWTAIQDKVKSIKNGMNLEMPGPSELDGFVKEALESGQLTEEELDRSLEPLITLYNKVKSNPNKGMNTDLTANHTVARTVAEEAIVLLQNDGVLPLNTKKIGVIGSFASAPRINGGGSASLKPFIKETPLEYLEQHFEVMYAKGYEEDHTNDQLLNEAKQVIEQSDTILYFTGTTTKLESEGRDRPHMSIPEDHMTLFRMIQNDTKDVIVICNNGSALDLKEISEGSNAIIESWFLGGANGKALVDVIRGTVNPSGKLSETFPLSITHTPHYKTFPAVDDDVLYYGDLINNGYRYYDTHDYPVLFPFGYGLSYTTFEYSDISVTQKNEEYEVSVVVKNTGDTAGKDVVQVYVSHKDSFYAKPEKELKAFQKVSLEPNESKQVTIMLPRSSFEMYSEDYDKFVVEAGTYHILVGNSSRDIYGKEELHITSNDRVKKPLDQHQPINKFIQFKPEVVEELIRLYGTIEWFDLEQPMWRILWRIQRDYKLSDDEYIALKNKVYGVE